MATLHVADAARLLGKPERTVRRWAARGRLPATRTTDGWLIELDLDEHGQVAATDRTNGHMRGQVASVPSALLQDLLARAEQAAYWQGRASVLEQRVQALEHQLALPPPEPAPPRAWWPPTRWFASR